MPNLFGSFEDEPGAVAPPLADPGRGKDLSQLLGMGFQAISNEVGLAWDLFEISCAYMVECMPGLSIAFYWQSHKTVDVTSMIPAVTPNVRWPRMFSFLVAVPFGNSMAYGALRIQLTGARKSWAVL